MYLLCRMCMWHFPGKALLCAERDASDTSGDTPQLRGGHIGRNSTGTISASAPHFEPLDNANPGREVTKPTFLKNILVGSTEPCAREGSPAFLGLAE